MELQSSGSAANFTDKNRLGRDPIGEEEGCKEKGHKEDGGSKKAERQEVGCVKGQTHQEGCVEKESGEKNRIEEGFLKEEADRFEKTESLGYACRIVDARCPDFQGSKVEAGKARLSCSERQRRRFSRIAQRRG